MVSRDAMRDAFLTSHPEFEPQRAALVDVHTELSQFPVDTSRWNTLSAASS
jgi:hypothetical protein